MSAQPQALAAVPLADRLDRALIKLGEWVAWIFFLLMLVILTQVILRRGFSAGLVALEELQWHLYAIGVFIGAVYAQANNSHVRVDIFHAGFGPKAKSIIEILGLLFLLMPFLLLLFWHSLDFVYESWRIDERSLAPAGLPLRWLIKSLIPATMVLLMLAALNRLLRDAIVLKRLFSGTSSNTTEGGR
ncbi:TRAP transporter small permease subunit [Oceanobacter mangrovi]|uniref:TRAP transporter small permease subunit n=1 Tax=Oceanobacter mangrovi TaxID=2862510 RepID=UPI001C8E2946|nr:TRAP transporter small permease subunit [Oceanobacter mangrovi]